MQDVRDSSPGAVTVRFELGRSGSSQLRVHEGRELEAREMLKGLSASGPLVRCPGSFCAAMEWRGKSAAREATDDGKLAKVSSWLPTLVSYLPVTASEGQRWVWRRRPSGGSFKHHVVLGQ